MNNYLKLGFFVAVGIVVIAVSIIAAGAFTFSKTYSIYTKFDNISGLTKKAKVKIAGINIGVLKSVSLEGSKAKLKLSIDKKVVLYKNASAKIVSMGVIGTKYIEIVPGDASYPVLKDGDSIFSSRNLSVEDILINIADRLSKVLENEKDGNMLENLAISVRSLREVLATLASQDGQFKSLIGNVNKLSDELLSISVQNKQNLSDTILFVRSVSEKVDSLVSRVQEGKGLISTFVDDEKTSGEVKETLISAKRILNSVSGRIEDLSKWRFGAEFLGKCDLISGMSEVGLGVKVVPSANRFFYVGFLNFPRFENGNYTNGFCSDILFGLRYKKVEFYGGTMKESLGFGLGYSFFQPANAPYKTVEFCLSMCDFNSPEVEASLRFGLAKWFYAGLGVGVSVRNVEGNPNVSYRIMPCINVKI